MKKLLLLALVTAITAFITYLLVYNHFTGLFPWSEPDEQARTQVIVDSKVLNEERTIIVQLPRNYDSLKRYPVMYVLDGNTEELVNTFQVLSEAGYAPSCVVVGIPNLSAQSRQRDLTPPYLKMDIDKADSPPGQGDRFLTFIATELIPFIENNYSVSDYRMFSGSSRGGLLVMHSLMFKPELFQARFCFSSPFWRQDQMIVSKVREFLNSRDSLSNFIYLCVGEAETENMKTGFEAMTKLFRQTSVPGLTFESNYTAGADHQNNTELSMATAIGKWARYARKYGQTPSLPENKVLAGQ
ncbi:MAG: alpha/beta hydrolase [Bacteroidota bacterium]